MTEQNHTTGLFAALVRAQRIARAVEKDAHNSFHRYSYASSEAVISEARGALGEAGLAFFAVSYEVVRGEFAEAAEREPEPKDAKKQDHAKAYGILRAKYRLVHEGGEATETESVTSIIPERGRPVDKAIASAKTFDLAYMLRALLLLPRVEEDTEVDRRDDRGHALREERRSQPPARAEEPGPREEETRDRLREQRAREQLKAFADLLGPARCREILGRSSQGMTVDELEAAVTRLGEAQHAAVDAAKAEREPGSDDDEPTPRTATRREVFERAEDLGLRSRIATLVRAFGDGATLESITPEQRGVVIARLELLAKEGSR